MTLTDRIAVVTGTTSGIGAALAGLLLGRGWSVLGVGRRPAAIRHAGYQHLQLDLADRDGSSVRLAAEVGPRLGESRWIRVGLVNNAAVAESLKPLARLGVEELERIYRVNTIAPIWLMGLVARTVRAGVALRVANVSSGAATLGLPGLAGYGSSKAALRLAGMTLANEWDSPEGGRADAAILSYEPGLVDTEMQQAARSVPPAEFPWVGMFRDFHDRGLLQPPEAPAGELAEFLESASPPRFSEQRLGEVVLRR